MEKSKCPEFRFKHFNESWNQQTLGDMFLPLSNNTLSRADLNYDNGQIKNIHYGDILVKYAAVLDCRNDKIPFITDGEISDFKNQFLQNGDVIFADTAEDKTVGKAIEISAVDDNYIVSGLHTMAYRPKIKLSPYYLGHYLNSNAYHHQLLSLMQGIKVLSVSRTNLAKTIIKYPSSVTEQTQIGNFFQNLDQSIALHEKKLAQTQNLKRAMLEKMFPKAGCKQPEIRLKGFSGDWEEFGLFDIALYKNGKSHESEVVVKGKYIIVNSKFISTNGVVRKFCDSQIEPLFKDDIVFVLSDVPNGKALSKAFLIDSDGQYTLNQRIACLSPNEKADAYFLYILINRNPYFLKFDDGVGQTNLSLADMEKFTALYPCNEEQMAIGSFFKQLDETLVLQQQQLQTLKNLKQAFLEKMFV